jgi:phosphoglycolate phosphatase
MAVPTIVFDLDGTLVDTAPDLVETLNVIFTREGLAPLPYDTARNLVGGGVKAMIANGIEAEGSVLAPARLEQMFTDFIGRYSDHIADRTTFSRVKGGAGYARRTWASACSVHEQA